MTIEQKALEYGEQIKLIFSDMKVGGTFADAVIKTHVDAFIDGAKWMKEEMSKADASENNNVIR